MHAEEGSLLNMQHQDPSAEVGEVTVAPSSLNSCARQAHQTGATGLCGAVHGLNGGDTQIPAPGAAPEPTRDHP